MARAEDVDPQTGRGTTGTNCEAAYFCETETRKWTFELSSVKKKKSVDSCEIAWTHWLTLNDRTFRHLHIICIIFDNKKEESCAYFIPYLPWHCYVQPWLLLGNYIGMRNRAGRFIDFKSKSNIFFGKADILKKKIIKSIFSRMLLRILLLCYRNLHHNNNHNNKKCWQLWLTNQI